MASNKLKSVFLPLAAIAVGLIAVTLVTRYLERVRPSLPEGYADSDLSMNGSRLEGFALGFEGLMADWYWMRSLQYVGEKISSSESDFIDLEDLRDLNPRLLYPLLENATDLDPHFIAAFSYGAIVLPAIDPAKAILIAEKGIANNPNEWRLYQHLGYIYWRQKDYEKAGDTYQKGANVPGSAPFMKMMAASMKTQGGSRETARMIFRQMLADAEDEQTKITAERRLQGLNSMEELDAVRAALDAYKQRNGRCVADLSEIYPALRDVKLSDGNQFRIDKANRLIDPTNVPYIFVREACSVSIDQLNTGLPLR